MLEIMKQLKIAIIDLGTGNLLSVKRALEKFKNNVIITNNKEDLFDADKIVLPGVGAFKTAMNTLKKLKLITVIKSLHLKKKPILGICLGMQILMEESEEFQTTRGLGLIKGKVVAIKNKTSNGKQLKKPHIGWNIIKVPDNNKNNTWKNTPLENINNNSYVYYLHSFSAVPKDKLNILAETSYGGYNLTAAIIKENTMGCQFHPEKSGKIGLNILKSFST